MESFEINGYTGAEWVNLFFLWYFHDLGLHLLRYILLSCEISANNYICKFIGNRAMSVSIFNYYKANDKRMFKSNIRSEVKNDISLGTCFFWVYQKWRF